MYNILYIHMHIHIYICILYIHINTYNVLYIHIYHIYSIHARTHTHTKERDLQWNECRNERLTTAPRSTAQWMKLRSCRLPLWTPTSDHSPFRSLDVTSPSWAVTSFLSNVNCSSCLQSDFAYLRQLIK